MYIYIMHPSSAFFLKILLMDVYTYMYRVGDVELVINSYSLQAQ